VSDLDVAGGHLGELLSAELDGELTPEETAFVATHIALCEHCRLERDELFRVKSSIRALGPVEPPFGFEQRLLRAGRARRTATGKVALSLVATAAAWVAVLGFGADLSGTESVRPPVDDVRAFVGGAPLDLIGGRKAKDGRPDSRVLPASLIGLPREATAETPDGQLVTYGSGGEAITVYLQTGNVDWESLTGGRRSGIGGLPGKPWQSTDDDETNALVFQDRDAMALLVGDVDQAQLVDAARDLPPYDAPEPSVGDRLRDAGESLIDAFGLGG
jgi:hypothetical protein